jgi:hypothetical protein
MARRRGYPMPIITRAREHGAAGWKAAEVRRLIGEEFPDHTPTLTTVSRWIDSDYAERQRECCRHGRATMAHRWGWRRRVRRIRELRDAGLRFPEVVKVLRLDFGLDLTLVQVEKLARGEFGEDFARLVLNCPRPSEAETA